jgi:GT2 family glycosyltransferase
VTADDRIVVAFASGSKDLTEPFAERVAQIAGSRPLYVVSEFPPSKGRWIPWLVGRTLAENRARILDAIAGRKIAHAAMILQHKRPYWRMRAIAFAAAPWRLLCYNENLDHFALHPRSLRPILRHLWWRFSSFVRFETHPGGHLYTHVWRVFHPHAYVRPFYFRLALLAGALAERRKRSLPPRTDAPMGPELPDGISVVIPSRQGRELLEGLMPGLARELEGLTGEVIVVDNGSSDGTESWLAREYPQVRCLVSPAPLSFAEAVNRGIREARYSRTLLLNNDMVLEQGFFPPLLSAFGKVPDLFAATAQIFFPEGVRREETGKAVFRPEPGPYDFPVTCLEPIEGEDLSYVLYGSGGCTLYDTRKLRALGGMDEAYRPAYVEDLELGYRGWLRGWPSVFAAGAKLLHLHRSTTRRYYSETEAQIAVEVNYLRFLARSTASPELFRERWRSAVWRLNLHAVKEPPEEWPFPALKMARHALSWVAPAPAPAFDERLLSALGSGEAVSFPGHAPAHDTRETILIASPYLPYPLSHGGAVRMFNLMRRAARDFNLVLIAFCDKAATPDPALLAITKEVVLVRRMGSHMRPLTGRPDVVEEHDTPAFRAALRELIRKHRPAAVQLEFTQMGLYAEDCGDVPTLLVEHDITLDLYTQLMRERPEWETAKQLERWRSFEAAVWRQVSCVVTMSEKDRRSVTGARRVETLANGVDLERFQPPGTPPEPRRLLFIGAFAHLPNLMALEFFLREVWPGLQAAGARLHVISGARAEHYLELYRDRVQVDLSQPGIEVEGFVSDVRGAYQRAEIVVAPLLASAGTNIKILEAMAMGRAVVSTPAGINGLDLSPGEDVVLAESASAMTSAILELFQDPARRAATERAARRTVEREFGWDAIGVAQARLYRELLQSP